MRANDARTATCALDVVVTWRGGTRLQSSHLSPPRSYVLREHGEGEAAFVVSRDWLGASEHELVSVERGRVVVHGPDASTPLRLGEQRSVEYGPLTFRVRLSEPVSVPAAVRARRLDAAPHLWTLASLFLHGLALCCMAVYPPRASSLSFDMGEESLRYASYLATAAAPVELPWDRDSDIDGAEHTAGESARQRGDEGQAGRPEISAEDKGLAIRGNHPQRAVPEVHAGSVAQLGILGVLAAHGGSVGATSVFGGQALGYDPHDAIGRLFGTDLGASLGFGGLGMRGAGRGGGGDAWGTIGVGKLNTGDGAAGAPGRGTLSRLTRKERVPQLRVGEVVANGSLSKEIIRRVIHRNLAQVRACYEQGLSSRPELAGRVSIRFMIAPSGSVQQALVGESSLGSAEVEACLARGASLELPRAGGRRLRDGELSLPVRARGPLGSYRGAGE